MIKIEKKNYKEKRMFNIILAVSDMYINQAAVLINNVISKIDKNKRFIDFFGCDLNTYEHKNHDYIETDFNQEYEDKQEGIVFHILTDYDFNDSVKEKFYLLAEKLSSHYTCKINFKHMQSINQENLHGWNGRTSMYLILFLSSILQKDLKKALYLDTDLYINCDIRELFAINLKDNIIACVNTSKSSGSLKSLDGKNDINIDSSGWFNSGLTLINVPEYIALEPTFKNIMQNYEISYLAVETVLNYAIQKKRLQLPVVYNFCVGLLKLDYLHHLAFEEEVQYGHMYYSKQFYNEKLPQAKILHYCYMDKPWNRRYTFSEIKQTFIECPCFDMWWDMALGTPYFSDYFFNIRQELYKRDCEFINQKFVELESKFQNEKNQTLQELKSLEQKHNSYLLSQENREKSLKLLNLEQDLINKKLNTKKLYKELNIKEDVFMPRINLIQVNSAKERIHSHLAYKLGLALIENSKSIKGYIRLPYVLSYIKDKHKKEQRIYNEKIKDNPSLKLPPLESYPDYEEALKEKQCITYKLGEALIENMKRGGALKYIKFMKDVRRIKRQFKNERKDSK